jgi:hypothetical protein
MRISRAGVVTAALISTMSCEGPSVGPLGQTVATFALIDPVPRFLYVLDGDSVHVVAETLAFRPDGLLDARRVRRLSADSGTTSDTKDLIRGTYTRSEDTLIARIGNTGSPPLRYVITANGRTLTGPQLSAIGNGSLIVHTYRRIE